jgi:hypothetical protein
VSLSRGASKAFNAQHGAPACNDSPHNRFVTILVQPRDLQNPGVAQRQPVKTSVTSYKVLSRCCFGATLQKNVPAPFIAE